MWIKTRVLCIDRKLKELDIEEEHWEDAAFCLEELESFKQFLNDEGDLDDGVSTLYFKSGETFIVQFPIQRLMELVEAKELVSANA